MSFNLKIIYIFSIFAIFFLCHLARAATIENFSFDLDNLLSIEGSCVGYRVAIHLVESDEILYSSEIECREGNFVFTDNLSEWKIAPRKYFIKVYDANSPLSNPSDYKEIMIENNIILLDEENNDQEYSEEETWQELNPNIFGKIINFISQWIRGAIVAFKELIAEKITTSRLCIGDTCVEEGDLKGFLKNGSEKDNQFNEDNFKKDNSEPAEDKHVEDAPVEDDLAESDVENSDFEVLDAGAKAVSSTND